MVISDKLWLYRNISAGDRLPIDRFLHYLQTDLFVTIDIFLFVYFVDLNNIFYLQNIWQGFELVWLNERKQIIICSSLIYNIHLSQLFSKLFVINLMPGFNLSYISLLLENKDFFASPMRSFYNWAVARNVPNNFVNVEVKSVTVCHTMTLINLSENIHILSTCITPETQLPFHKGANSLLPRGQYFGKVEC